MGIPGPNLEVSLTEDTGIAWLVCSQASIRAEWVQEPALGVGFRAKFIVLGLKT